MFERIIVPLDLTPFGERAVPVATAMARRAGLPVELVAVTGRGMDSGADYTALTALTNRLVCPTEPARVIEGDDIATSLGEVLAAGNNLICMSTHGRRPFSDFALGGVARSVTRHSPVPVVLVGPKVGEAADVALERLVVALDGTEPIEEVVAAVAPLAQLLAVPVTVMSVEQPTNVLNLTLRTVGTHLTAWVEAIAQRLQAEGIEADAHVAHVGRAAAVILAEAGAGSWLVLGQRRRPELERVAEGSLSSRLLREAAVPVIALPAFTPAPARAAEPAVGSEGSAVWV